MAAGLVKTLALLVYFFCLAYPQHGIAWNGLSSPPLPFAPSSYEEYNQGCRGGSTLPFCGDSSSTTVLKCCDVVAHSAPTDFQEAVDYCGASSCADLTCQLCSAPSASGSAASRLICAVSSLCHDDDGEKAAGMSTATTIALLAGGIVLVLIVVLGLICHMNLRIGMAMVVKMIQRNKNEHNINVNVDSDAKAVAASTSGSAALALSASDARAMAKSNASAQAILQARWYLVNGMWVLLDRLWRVVFVDDEVTQLPDHWRRALPQPQHGDGGPIIEEIE